MPSSLTRASGWITCWPILYEEIIARDKTNLDIFWLKDKSLADLDNLPDPDILANEIIENIEAGLESFWEVASIVEQQPAVKLITYLEKTQRNLKKIERKTPQILNFEGFCHSLNLRCGAAGIRTLVQ